MGRKWQVRCVVLGMGGWMLLGSARIHGAGFSIFEQGTKAMGMAGAFTAQADDPSALFHNAGGLAFFDRQRFALGTTFLRSSEASFRGLDPFPGAGVRGDQVRFEEFPSHFYWVRPLGGGLTFGLGLYSPFGLTTEWQDPDLWPGRFLNVKTRLNTLDVNPTLGFRLGPRLGLGVGAIARVSDVELNRRVGAVNPFTQQVADVAALRLESDVETGFGWNAGLLFRVTNSFSVGLSYRSKVTVDYSGDTRFRQIPTGFPQFDAEVAQTLPVDGPIPVETSVEYPDMASLGLAFALSRNLLLETDFNRTGWSTFDQVTLVFPEGQLPDAVLPQRWDDAESYRVGLRWTATRKSEWRIGYLFDETPQPEESVGPLLPDADRNGFSLGYGFRGRRFTADVAVMYLDFERRTTRTNQDQFFGTYKTKGWLFGLTLGW